jgi:ligand-binding SRPBCC domain-containing protein
MVLKVRWLRVPDVVFRHSSIVAAPCSRVFRWHQRPEALLDLMPLHRWVRIEHQVGGLHDGGRVTIAIGVGLFRLQWEARHFGFIQDEQFCDELLKGPFALWRHTHRFEAMGPHQTVYEDRVEYELPGGAIVNYLSAPVVLRLLARTFEWRHQVVHKAMAQA